MLQPDHRAAKQATWLVGKPDLWTQNSVGERQRRATEFNWWHATGSSRDLDARKARSTPSTGARIRYPEMRLSCLKRTPTLLQERGPTYRSRRWRQTNAKLLP